MTQFALDSEISKTGKPPFTIFDAHNATWSISSRMFENAPRLLKPILRVESKRIKRYEGMLVRNFSHTMVVIEPDRDALLQGISDDAISEVAQRISVIPIAVDTDELKPVQRQTNSMNIMTLGSLNYPPNADGIRWFMRKVFPLVLQQEPEATLTVVGKAPPADFVQLAAQNPDKIRITGYVTDLTPFVEQSAILVVPVRAGSGMRVRILEAFARGIPVVTTTIGVEGIKARHENQLLVADEPDDFSQMTVRLLRDGELQQRLAENGRILAERRYDWRTALKKMDAVYARVRAKV
jgi:glycosyltransferase involved in cell wall biosynthesis